jgi:hypothetical protein
MNMAEKQTSSRVSSIAARLITFTSDDFDQLAASSTTAIVAFCDDIRTLAASAMSQDETKGQGGGGASV